MVKLIKTENESCGGASGSELPLDLQDKIMDLAIRDAKHKNDRRVLGNLRQVTKKNRDAIQPSETDRITLTFLRTKDEDKDIDVLTDDKIYIHIVTFDTIDEDVVWEGMVILQQDIITEVAVAKYRKSPNEDVYDEEIISHWPNGNILPSLLIGFVVAMFKLHPHIVSMNALDTFLKAGPYPKPNQLPQKNVATKRTAFLENYKSMDGVLGYTEATRRFLKHE